MDSRLHGNDGFPATFRSWKYETPTGDWSSPCGRLVCRLHARSKRRLLPYADIQTLRLSLFFLGQMHLEDAV